METRDARIDWVLTEIERRLDRALPLEGLPAAVNLSSSRFAHIFREQVGLSPGRYLRARRLDRARFLLETTFLSIKEVMARVGLNDASHFTREFRRCHGLPPRQWRALTRATRQTAPELASTVNK